VGEKNLPKKKKSSQFEIFKHKKKLQNHFLACLNSPKHSANTKQTTTIGI
jgi:hypothetical protein